MIQARAPTLPTPRPCARRGHSGSARVAGGGLSAGCCGSGARSQAVLRPRLRDVALEALVLFGSDPVSPVFDDLVEVSIDMDVPELDRVQFGQAPHRPAVGAGDREVDGFPLLIVEATIASSHREAGDEAPYISLKRTWQRPVEVVDAEHEPAIGAGVSAEVRQLRVTAQLYLEASPGPIGEIGRHHNRRPAKECERRDEHSPAADRIQLTQSCARLGLEQLDRICSPGPPAPTPHGWSAALPCAWPCPERHDPPRSDVHVLPPSGSADHPCGWC